ncbi:MAG: ATP-dependent RNA helicase RhlB [Ignavibacteria bacterium]|nr:ATP-dependent RNA helicase RhlB [Ignavibacteria bacterium]MCU7501864.1 ATP-dependent RNA helicase RhlB [Ignavibacteria bacterium]MCU7514790.1 ATP-dependent RNA helicase RhlB [Ignavibacteria bacterium]
MSNTGKKKKEGTVKEVKVSGAQPGRERRTGRENRQQQPGSGRQQTPQQAQRTPQQASQPRGKRPQPQQPQQQQQASAAGTQPRRERQERPAPKVQQPPKKQPDNWDVAQFKVEPAEGKTRFHDLNLPKELMHAIYDLGFQYCTPIQAEILFNTLNGKDATGRAQTGTGKTAAFLITIITRLMKEKLQTKRRNGAPRALIIAPTRELVMQIASDAINLGKYTDLVIMSVYGGMDYQKQKRQLNGQQVDVLVATPGRLLDFYNRHDVHLSQVEIMVIDEADRMLDMGFIPDVRKIVRATPPKEKRQTLFFSATLTPDVERLASYWTKEAVNVEIAPAQVEVESVKQIIYIVTSEEKYPLVYNLITQQNMDRVIIFANRRDETQGLTDHLLKHGISCALISGDVDQRQRIRTLDDFKNGRIRVLVATDVASRGIHVEGISHVINYTLPQDPEDYVHRIGRTGRAGATGTSISFATEDDSFYIPAIEGFLGHSLHCIQPEEKLLQLPEELDTTATEQTTQAAPAEAGESGSMENKPQDNRPQEKRRQSQRPQGSGGYRRGGGNQQRRSGSGGGPRPQGRSGQKPQPGENRPERKNSGRQEKPSPERKDETKPEKPGRQEES